MQEFNKNQQSLISNSNAVQLSQEHEGTSSMIPPDLFAEPNIQLKEEEGVKDTGDIALIDTEIATPTSLVAQPKISDAEEEDRQSEAQLKLDYSNGPLPPPSKPSNNNSASITTPFQMKKGKAPSSQKSSDAGNVMSKMENSFGADFSEVKINTNSSTAKDAGALAFTQGNQIDFAPGQYNPQTSSGQELLGHELTHVVQQRQGRVKPTGQVNGKALNDDPGLEKEADDGGTKAAKGILQKKESPLSNTISDTHVSFPLQTSPIQREKAAEDTTPVNVDENAIAQELISAGAKNENYVTDEVFYKRYPGIHRRKLVFPNNTDAETVLVRDWMRIRNDVVRPLLAGEEKPGTEKPKKDKPKKEEPEKDQPGKEEPEKEKPGKDKPGKDKPDKDPGKEMPIEIPEGWTYDDYFNLAKAIAEIGRLSGITIIGTSLGIVSGQGAAFLNLVQDLIHSVERKDLILGITTLLRNLAVHFTNAVSDASLGLSMLQDVVAAIEAIALLLSGGASSPIAVATTAFLATANSTLSAINVVGDGVVVLGDMVVLWHLKTSYDNLPENDPEKAAYKELLDGYKVNFLLDALGLVLDLTDVVTGGFAHGEFAEKGVKVLAKVLKLTLFGSSLIQSVANAFWGTGAIDTIDKGFPASEPVQKKDDESETPGNIETAISHVISFVQGNDLVSSGIDYVGEKWDENMDILQESLSNLEKDDEALIEFFAMVEKTVSDLEQKVTAVDGVLEITNGVKENGESILAQIENAEAMINALAVPNIEFPEVDIADNPIADAIEGAVNSGLEGVEDKFNEYIEQLNVGLDEFKVVALQGTSYAKEQVLHVLEEVASFEATMIDFKSFLIEHIAEVKGMLQEAGDPKALLEAVFKQILDILGIEGELDAQAIVQGFHDFRRELINLLERLKVEKDNDGNTAQRKANPTNSSENIASFESAFQLKQNPNSPLVDEQPNGPYQLTQNENLNSKDKKKEHDQPFVL